MDALPIVLALVLLFFVSYRIIKLLFKLIKDFIFSIIDHYFDRKYNG